MLIIVYGVIFGRTGPQIAMATSVNVLALRFICGLLMHLNVESDIRNGLKMMKYVINHTNDFSAPFNAFLCGFC